MIMKTISRAALGGALCLALALATGCQGTSPNPHGIRASEAPGFLSALEANHAQAAKLGHEALVIAPRDHGLRKSMIPAGGLEVAERLVAHGYKTYLVGGAVRDLLLDRPANDFDFVTTATYDEIQALFPALTFHSIRTGQRFGQLKNRGEDVDLASLDNLPQGYEGQPLPQGNGVLGKDLLSDSYTRDLTMNSLYFDVGTEEIIDYHGGLRDLMSWTMDTIVEPRALNTSKPLSVLRVVRFQARYGMGLSERLASDLSAHLTEYIKAMTPKELIAQLFKIGADGAAAASLEILDGYGVLPDIYPDLKGDFQDAGFRGYVKDALAGVDAVERDTRQSNPCYAAAFVAAPLLVAAERRVAALGIKGAVRETLLRQAPGEDPSGKRLKQVGELLTATLLMMDRSKIKDLGAFAADPAFAPALGLLRSLAKWRPGLSGAVAYFEGLPAALARPSAA
ncbi:MAG: hypothetical protein K6A65_02895 [Succinivibrionaceae bacterium]|nr:hypothetical protein [Succinivibrionaceae bacterium]